MERKHVNIIREIIYRIRAGESERQIGTNLGLSRPTVHKYKLLAEEKGYLNVTRAMVEEEELLRELGSAAKPPKTASSIEPHRDFVMSMLDKGVEMMAIWQRLRDEQGYRGSYSSLRRFVSRLELEKEPESYTRVHTAAGEEMQVDFGYVGKLYDPKSGGIRNAYVFVGTLGYSRHQYAEIVFDQKIPTWIALHRRSFEYFGGIPKVIVPDNLKAAVKKVLIYDPILGEAYRRMAQYYGFLVNPTRPRTPEHKGKVENGVHYVQRNFMAGRTFESVDSANRRLKQWITEIAGVRQHGTTRQAPLALFNQHEKQALLPLPKEAYVLNEVRMAKVHKDCHIQVGSCYYSIPYRYVSKKVTVHIGEKMLEVYDEQQNLVCTHVLLTKKGAWSTRNEHYPMHKAEYLMQTPQYCLKTAKQIGPATHTVVSLLFSEKPLYQLRSVQAILRLEKTVGNKRLEDACKRALFYGDYHYRRIKEILNAALDREALPESPPKEERQPHLFARKSREFFINWEDTSK
jgi:transposase